MLDMFKAQLRPRKECATITIANSNGVRLRGALNEADRNKGDVVRIWFPDEVVVTPELMERFEAWLAGSHGVRT
jgi:hypothetical protein